MTNTIDRIKAAVDAGLTVTLADSAAYTVIKDSVGQYLIAFQHGKPGASYIGLHGRPGTQYADRINMSGDWVVSGNISGALDMTESVPATEGNVERCLHFHDSGERCHNDCVPHEIYCGDHGGFNANIRDIQGIKYNNSDC